MLTLTAWLGSCLPRSSAARTHFLSPHRALQKEVPPKEWEALLPPTLEGAANELFRVLCRTFVPSLPFFNFYPYGLMDIYLLFGDIIQYYCTYFVAQSVFALAIRKLLLPGFCVPLLCSHRFIWGHVRPSHTTDAPSEPSCIFSALLLE